MNISQISFGIRYNDGFDILSSSNQTKPGHTNKYTTMKEPAGDVYVRRPRTERYEKKEKYQPKHMIKQQPAEIPNNQKAAIEFLNKRKKAKTIKTVIASSLATLLLAQGVAALNQPTKVVTIQPNNYSSIYQVSADYKCDVNAILAYNNLKTVSDYIQQDEIKVPTMFSNLQDEIDSIENKLCNPNINAKTRETLETRLEKLKEKQTLQKSLATVYTDGKYVYYTINTLGNNTRFDIKEKYSGGINVEEFKQIFDIQDKAIRQNNEIDFEWGYEAEVGGYKDYTHANIGAGLTIKVPVNAIKTGSSVNLD